MGNDPRSTTSLTRDIVAQPRAMDNVADLYRYISVMQPIARTGRYKYIGDAPRASVYTRPCALIAIKHSTLHYRDRLPPPAARLIFPGGGTTPPCALTRRAALCGTRTRHAIGALIFEEEVVTGGCKIIYRQHLRYRRPCLATGAPFCSRSLILFLLLTRGR